MQIEDTIFEGKRDLIFGTAMIFEEEAEEIAIDEKQQQRSPPFQQPQKSTERTQDDENDDDDDERDEEAMEKDPGQAKLKYIGKTSNLIHFEPVDLAQKIMANIKANKDSKGQASNSTSAIAATALKKVRFMGKNKIIKRIVGMASSKSKKKKKQKKKTMQSIQQQQQQQQQIFIQNPNQNQ